MSSFLTWTALEEWTFDGSIFTYDHDARAGFVNVQPAPDAWVSKAQREVRPGVLVDLDAEGRVRGIETLGHAVGAADLLAVIRWMNER